MGGFVRVKNPCLPEHTRFRLQILLRRNPSTTCGRPFHTSEPTMWTASTTVGRELAWHNYGRSWRYGRPWGYGRPQPNYNLTQTHNHKQTHTHTDRQTDRQTDRHTDRHTHTQTHTHTHT